MEREVLLLKKNSIAPKVLFFSCLLAAALSASCNFGLPIFLYAETGVEDRARGVKVLGGSDLPQIPNGTKYSFIVLTDPHFGEKKYKRREDDFIKKFKELLQNSDEGLKPRFIVNIGDTLDGGHEDEADDYNKAAARWIQTAKDELGASDYKVYAILGNHDLYNNGWEVWKKKIYPYTSYYKFTINAGGASNGGFDFYFLDSGNGTLGDPQIEDLERNLSASSRPKIIFMHYPLYAGGIFYFALDDVHERARLISAFAESNVKYVFEGHKHQQHDYDFNNFKEAVIGAYLQERFFGLVTVDEAAASVQFTRMGY